MMIDDTGYLADYLAAALWTATDDDGNPIDSDHDVFDFTEPTRERAIFDLRRFVSDAGDLIAAAIECDGYSPDMIGHDYWLTRNGHGAGFWDRDLGDVGDRLSEIARSHGERYVFVTGDAKLAIEPC